MLQRKCHKIGPSVDYSFLLVDDKATIISPLNNLESLKKIFFAILIFVA